MIQLTQGGAYLLNGTEIVSDGADATAQIKNKTGREVSRSDAAKNTIAYGILEKHNTSGNMEKLKIKFPMCLPTAIIPCARWAARSMRMTTCSALPARSVTAASMYRPIRR